MADLVFTNVRDYKDVSLSWSKNPITHDIQTLTGAQAVIRSIKTLLSTHAGAVPFYPRFASNLPRLLFEPIDPITTSLIETEIKDVIDAYEPRADVKRVVAVANPDENAYRIDLEIDIISTAQPVVFSVFLKRIR